MLSGRRAFKGGSSAETLSAILKEEPPDLSGVKGDVPPALERILRRCLEKDPDERFRSAHDLAFALDAVSGLATSVPPSTAPALGRRKAVWPWQVVGSIAVVATVAVAVGVRFRSGSGAEGPRRAAAPGIRVEKLTSRGNADDAAISPDGRYLAYSSWDSGPAIWLRDLVEKTETRLASMPKEAEFSRILRFATDGQAVYYSFLPRPGGQRSLYRAPLIGGEPRLLQTGGWGHALSPDDKRVALVRSQGDSNHLFVADTEAGQEKEFADLGRGGNLGWSPDGSQLLFHRSKEGRDSLLVVQADGTGERSVFDAPGPLGQAWWKPRGDGLVCMIKSNERDARLFDVDLAGGDAKPVGSTVWGQINALSWLPDGNGFVIQGYAKGEDHNLWLVSSPDGRTERLPADSHDYSGLGMTANGAQLVSVQRVERSEILVSTDPDKGSFKKIRSGTSADRLCWTADGRIVYSSNDGGSYDLYLCNADGSGRRQLTFDRASNETEPAASPDGRYIVFVSDRPGGGGLFRIDSDGMGLRSLTPPHAADRPDKDPHVTPDSRWVLYRHWDNGPTLWRVPIDGGTPALIKGVRPALPGGAVEQAFGGSASPDGKSLAFLYFTMDPKSGTSPVALVVSSLDGRILKRFPYRDTLLGAVNDNEHVQWSKDGRELYYAAFGGAHDLWRQRLAGGPRVRVAHLDEPPNYCAWSFDNNAIACSRTFTLSDVVLITNFH